MVDPTEALYLPQQVREMDAHAIGVLGIDGFTLMERAGAAAYAAMRDRWPRAKRVRVLCGVGNNAGDGFIVARMALADGLDVRVLQLGDASRLKGDAQKAARAYAGNGGVAEPWQAAALADADILVDAVFGTGLDRPVQADWAEALTAVNAAGKPVLAIDVPSGLHAGTGRVLGAAVRANLTVTFIALKTGLYTGAGPDYVGEVRLAGLGVPPAVYQRARPHARLMRPEHLRAALPARPRDAHKGHYGHALIIGGDLGMGGAARMAAEACARVGAGLTSLATRPEHCAAVIAARPEIMCHGVTSPAQLAPLLARATVVALGPGLGRESWGRTMFEQALQFRGPLLLDADALNLLADAPRRRGAWVLTPHPGEAARLLGTSAKRIQEDRFTAAEQLALQYGGVVVLKGAGTIVHAEGDVPYVCDRGNPGMASGGMGDVLTGAIAGLLAQGLSPLEAAAVGVQVHALAADSAAGAGERGLLAGDLMSHLRHWVNP